MTAAGPDPDHRPGAAAEADGPWADVPADPGVSVATWRVLAVLAGRTRALGGYLLRRWSLRGASASAAGARPAGGRPTRRHRRRRRVARSWAVVCLAVGAGFLAGTTVEPGGAAGPAAPASARRVTPVRSTAAAGSSPPVSRRSTVGGTGPAPGGAELQRAVDAYLRSLFGAG